MSAARPLACRPLFRPRVAAQAGDARGKPPLYSPRPPPRALAQREQPRLDVLDSLDSLPALGELGVRRLQQELQVVSGVLQVGEVEIKLLLGEVLAGVELHVAVLLRASLGEPPGEILASVSSSATSSLVSCSVTRSSTSPGFSRKHR